MIVLGIDTALPACSVALIDGQRTLAARSEPMMRGHQERLAPMTAEVMAESGVPFTAIDRIAVTVGPGSFTGLRVGLAFAKGLGLALGRPCIGVGGLQALAASSGAEGLVIAIADAKRGQVYWQAFDDAAALGEPEALDLNLAAPRLAALGRASLVGSGAGLLARAHDTVIDMAAPDPAVVARLGMAAPLSAPRPMYLRAPDARLPAA